MRWRLIVAIAAVTGVVVAGAGSLAHSHDNPTGFRRSGGPISPQNATAYALPIEVGQRFTDGFTLLSVSGRSPATIVSVQSVQDGSSLEYLGAMIAGQDRLYASDESIVGYPPNSDEISSANTAGSGPSNGYTADYSYSGSSTHAATNVSAGPAAGDYTYDSSGRLTTWTSGTKTRSTSYTYFDQPETTTLTTGSSTTGRSRYAYWADGTRAATITDAGGLSAAVITINAGDTSLLSNKTGVGTVTTTKATRAYTAAGMQVATRNVTDGFVWDAASPQGSIVATATSATTGATSQTQYYPYGQPTATGTPDRAIATGYIGQPHTAIDAATTTGASSGNPNAGYGVGPGDTIRTTARDYNTSLSRFTTPDSLFDINNPQSLNPYTYANDDPASESDPDGEIAEQDQNQAGGGVGSPYAGRTYRGSGGGNNGGESEAGGSTPPPVEPPPVQSSTSSVTAAQAQEISTIEATVSESRAIRMSDELDDPIFRGRDPYRRNVRASKTGTSALDELPPEVRSNVDDAIERAASGKVRFPNHDGKVYNNSDDLLPSEGNYTEWTAAEPGAKRGADRVIIDGDPANPNAIYYWDHVNPPVRIGP